MDIIIIAPGVILPNPTVSGRMVSLAAGVLNLFNFMIADILLFLILTTGIKGGWMFYAMLADLVVLVHILFVLFVVFGGLAALRRRWLLWYHLPAAVWGVAVELGGWVCPLTHLENHFRRLGGGGGLQRHILFT